MTVKELIELLKTYPQDLEVITSRYSDYKLVDETDFNIVKAADSRNYRNDGWIRRWYKGMEKEKLDSKEFFHIEGN